jgi:hypothetical protein
MLDINIRVGSATPPTSGALMEAKRVNRAVDRWLAGFKECPKPRRSHRLAGDVTARNPLAGASFAATTSQEDT